MSNPFEGKFKQFAAIQGAKSAQNHSQAIVRKSGDVFEDKPFSVEYRGIYRVAGIGQSASQLITFTTTAALGVFALVHVVPLWWGIYLAVPLALLFAFGVEKVKRSTLAIAAKHFLKYRTFGFVGVVALLTLCVSVAAALYGAKELPGVVYPKVARVKDGSSVEALTGDLKRIQADIDRTTGKLAQGKNWTAENRTLPRLQKERAALVERRDIAAKEAEARADGAVLEVEADRLEKIGKMQGYSIGAAVAAEAVFLVCTLFVFYYLFRSYVEANERQTIQAEPADQPAPTGSRATVTANLSMHENRLTKNAQVSHNLLGDRVCEHCGGSYIYAHNKQKYCSDKCRMTAWEARTGAKLRKNI